MARRKKTAVTPHPLINETMYYQYLTPHHKEQTLILLHSGAMAGVEWNPQIKSLSKHFNLLLPDLPGHGQSRLAPNQTLSIAMMGQAVIDMLAREALDKAHILGSSMGGAVALWITLNHPEVIKKMVLYRIGYQKNRATYAHTKAMASSDYWRQYGLQHWLSKLHQYQGTTSIPDPDAWQTVIADVSKILDPETSDHCHQLSDLNRIEAETLLIAGDRDPLIPLSELLAMYEAIPNTALWIMPKASHITATNTWRAECFANEIIRFLR